VAVAFIIVNNNSYRALEEFGRHFDIDQLPGVKLPHLDFRALAQGHGVKSIHVQRCEDVDAALQEIFSAKVPMLLQVDIQSSAA
jgi:benzoylformate decarboxylase